jgi:molybdopterin converting factor small subunit
VRVRIQSTGRLLLAGRYPKLKDVALDEVNITLALNEEYVTGTQPLKQGDVVALIPPISGG